MPLAGYSSSQLRGVLNNLQESRQEVDVGERDEISAYLTAELENLRRAIAEDDVDAVERRLEHVAAESGNEMPQFSVD